MDGEVLERLTALVGLYNEGFQKEREGAQIKGAARDKILALWKEAGQAEPVVVNHFKVDVTTSVRDVWDSRTLKEVLSADQLERCRRVTTSVVLIVRPER